MRRFSAIAAAVILMFMVYPATVFPANNSPETTLNHRSATIIAFGWTGDVTGTGPAVVCNSDGDLVTLMSIIEDSASLQARVGGRIIAVDRVKGVDNDTGLVRLGIAGKLAGSIPLEARGTSSPEKAASQEVLYGSAGAGSAALHLDQVLPLPLSPDIYYVRSDDPLPLPGTALYDRRGRFLGILVDRDGDDGRTAILAGPDRVLGLAEARCLEQDVSSWILDRQIRWAGSSQAAYLKAARTLMSGYPQEARRELEKVSAGPGSYDGEIRFTLGECYLSEGEIRQAIEAFTGALGPAVDPDVVNMRLAWAYSEAGNDTMAMAVCRTMLNRNPDNPWAATFLARLLNSQGRPEEAEPLARRATILDRKSPCAWTELAVAVAGQGGYSEAIDYFREAVKLDDQSLRSLDGLGLAYLMTGRFSDAVEALRNATALEEAGSEAWKRLAWACREVGMEQDVLGALRMAAAAAGADDSTATCCLAREYLRRGMIKEALACLEKALAESPDNPWLHYYLGRAWHDSGQAQEAMAEYRWLSRRGHPLAGQLMLRIVVPADVERG